MPNAVAYAMLLIWPVIALVLYRRMPVERALIWSILGGYLLLPPVAAIDLPMVPDFDKVSIPNLAAAGICLLVLGHRIEVLPRSRLARGLLVLFVVSPLATVLTNSEPVVFGHFATQWGEFVVPDSPVRGALPGMRIYDALSEIANQAIYILPFFLARHLLASEHAMREIVLALMVAGLIYSVPMLIEVRLSPQLNTWIYGFFQHSFDQMIRYGGFRPIVFLQHALWVAFFMLTCVMAAASLTRAAPPERRPRLILALVYLAVMLVLCRSLGPLVLAVGLLPMVLLLGVRWQLRIAAFLGAVALSYPLLRGAGLIPVDGLVSLASAISPERAQSLGFRFANEDMLLAHAAEKPFFGWGSWGRNLIHDMATGELLSVTDGRWIIVIGTYGWLGYIVEFGLLALPLALLARQAAHLPAGAVSPHAGTVALILGANMVDMLPNATLIPFTWLLAGAVMGYAETLQQRSAAGAGARRGGAAAGPARPRTVL